MEPLQTDGAACLEAALRYAERGWRVIDVYGLKPDGTCTCHKGKKCSSPGKHPRGDEWQKRATTNAATIRGWWAKTPDSNVGIQMGEESGIVDVELDDELEVNNYSKVFDGKPPETLCFKSARGTHYLYKWQPELPLDGIKDIAGIKVRIGGSGLGAMSVFPPSRHASGAVREWIDEKNAPLVDARTFFDAAAKFSGNGELPLCAAEPEQDERGLFKDEWTTAAKPQEHWNDILINGKMEGHRHDAAKELAGKLIGAMADVFDDEQVAVQRLMFLSWNRAENRPPSPDNEMIEIWGWTLKQEREKRLRLTPDAAVAAAVRRDDAGKTQNTWQLVIVDSEPPIYKLSSPLWPGDPVLLTAKQMRNGELICEQVLTQKNVWVPGSFGKLWRGDDKHPSLAADLLRGAAHEAAPAESKETYIIASLFHDALLRQKFGKILEVGTRPSGMGKSSWYEDGSVVFAFKDVLENMNFGVEKVTSRQLSKLLQQIGKKRHRCRSLGDKRLMKLDRDAVQRLERLLDSLEKE